MQKIIGLDIGSYSIKAVEIINQFKSYEISNYYENVIPKINKVPTEQIIPACMKQLFSENQIKADRIITAIPGQYISSRIMPFNFSDPSKVEAAVYAEIEDVVPYDLDDMILDHQIIGTMGDKTMALIVLTRKIFMENFLNHLKKVDIDPKLVDVDSLTFYNLNPYLDMEAGKCYGIVDVGHEKTSICLVQDGVLRLFRSINLGGRYITDFIAKDQEVSYDEAQRLKHEVSQILLPGSNDSLTGVSLGVAKNITQASNAIVRELGRTLYAFKSWEKSPVEKLYLSGGSSLIKGFEKFIEVEVGVNSSFSKISQSNLQISDHLVDKTANIAQGVSIALRAVTSLKKQSQINLRKDEYAYIQDYGSLFSILGGVAKGLSFIILLLTVSYGLKYYIFNQEINKIENIYKKQFFSVLPEMKNRYKNPKIPFSKIKRDSLTEIRDRSKSFKNSISQFKNVIGDSGSLLAIKHISENLDKEIKVDVVEYKYVSQPDGSGKIQLRVEADSFDTLAKFNQAISKIKNFGEIVEKSSDTKPGSTIKIAVYETTYGIEN